MFTEYEILDLIEETADIISDNKGMNVSYCESMDMTLFPVVVEAMLYDELEENTLGDLHFLAKNGRLIPTDYAGATFQEIKAYLLEHKQEILDEIEQDCRSYQGDYE